MNNNKLTPEGLNLIKSFEGLRLAAYQDGGGIWTIGYGHIKDVQPTDTCTPTQALTWLQEDIAQQGELPIQELVHVPLDDNEYSALVSLCFNCGRAPLLGHLGKYLNAEEFSRAANEFLVWNHINAIVSEGLTKRREAEKALFLTPTGE